MSTKLKLQIKIARWIFVLCAITLAVSYFPRSSLLPRLSYGPILHEETSDFSHIRVRGSGSKRHLLFVTDLGIEHLQSTVDLNQPEVLQVAYTRTLFASFLFNKKQERILIVGLGGGGMVRFLGSHFPDSKIEAVEIDPAVVKIADRFFETRENPGIVIHNEDAFVFFQDQHTPFDAIYLDAFLRPSVDKIAGGKTARLKTVEFLRTISNHLTSDGVVACNLVKHRSTTPDDISALREVFPTVEIFTVPGTGNLAVIASKQDLELTREEWIARAKSLEAALPVKLPFEDFVRSMQ